MTLRPYSLRLMGMKIFDPIFLQEKKTSLRRTSFLIPILFRLCSAGGAYSGARSAVDASTCVDGIDVAFGNAVNGTFGFACATSDAAVRNFMCHNDTSMNLFRYVQRALPKHSMFAF